jgi:hypothetical protein
MPAYRLGRGALFQRRIHAQQRQEPDVEFQSRYAPNIRARFFDRVQIFMFRQKFDNLFRHVVELIRDGVVVEDARKLFRASRRDRRREAAPRG